MGDNTCISLLDIEKDGKVRGILTKLFFALCLLILGSCYIIGMVYSGSPRWLTALFGSFFAAIGLLLGFLIVKYGKKLSDKKLLVFALSAFAVLVAFQFLAIYYLSVEPSWDFGGVYVSAREYVEHGRIITHEHYFERFYNNTGLLAIEIIYFKLLTFLGIPIQYFHGSFLNMLFIDAAIAFMLLFVRKLWGNSRALLFLIISLGFTPYILYAPIYYSDSMTMLFISLPLYLFVCCIKQEKAWIKALQLIFASLLLSMGTKTKGTVIILLVAMLFYIIFNFGIKKIIAAFLLLLIPFAGFSFAFDYAMQAKGIIKEENMDAIEFPMEYWLYMGLNNETYGGFSDPDFNDIYAEPDYAAKQKVAREGISNRLTEYGFTGTASHLANKIAYTYRDGTYFVSVALSRQPLKELGLLSMFRTGDRNFDLYWSWADGYNLVILGALIIGMVLSLGKRKFDMTAMLYLSLFGLALFLMIWERRSRYLLNFTPIMLALAANSILELFEFIKAKRKGDTKDESNVHSAQQLPD